MDKQTQKPDRATALIRKGELVLMIFRIKEDKEYLILPGGKIEPGETIEEAVMREVAEETSVEVTLGKQLTMIQTPDGRKHYIFECAYLSGDPKLADDSPEKLENSPANFFEPRWIPINKLSQFEMWPKETKPFLLSYLK